STWRSAHPVNDKPRYAPPIADSSQVSEPPGAATPATTHSDVEHGTLPVVADLRSTDGHEPLRPREGRKEGFPVGVRVAMRDLVQGVPVHEGQRDPGGHEPGNAVNVDRPSVAPSRCRRDNHTTHSILHVEAVD